MERRHSNVLSGSAKIIRMCWSKVLTLIFLIGTVVMFVQHDYIVDINYLKLDFYERSVFQSVEIKNSKLNRTFRVFTLCANVLEDLENEDLYKINIKPFKIITNVPMKTPILQTDVKVNELIKKNLFGFADLLKQGNVTALSFTKGIYCINNIQIDSNRLPPFIPAGEYKTQLTLLYGNMTLAIISGYGKVIYIMKQGRN